MSDGLPLTAEATDLLQNGAWADRIRALRTLQEEKRLGQVPVGAIVALLHAPEAHQRWAVVEALSCLGAPAVDPLLSSLREGGPEAGEFRRAVVVALGRLGPAAAAALPLLQEMKDDPWLGPCVRQALVALRPGARGRRWPLWIACGLGMLTAAAGLPASQHHAEWLVPLAGLLLLCLGIGLYAVREWSAVLALIAIALIGGVAGFWIGDTLAGVFGRIATELNQVGKP